MSVEEVSPVPGAADAGSVSERSAQRGAITCSGCTAEWTGLGKAHCSGCHTSFTDNRIDIYPVGLLRDLQHRKMRSLRRALRRPLNAAKRGDWRAFRNYFNGYLAEPTPMPVHGRRCGHGWTKRRARRDLIAHLTGLEGNHG